MTFLWESFDSVVRSLRCSLAFRRLVVMNRHSGPQGYLGFAPKVRDGNTFKCTFTAAGGWGSYEETSNGKQFKASLSVKWGAVKLVSLGLEFPDDVTVLTVTLGVESVPASIKMMNGRHRVVLDHGVILKSQQVLNVHV